MGSFSLEKFLWAQALIVFFGAFYLLRKSHNKGMRFRWAKRATRMPPAEMLRPTEMWTDESKNHADTNKGPRDLNVYFNYNGHSWDAFEALGLPAGSSLQKAVEAHEKICQTVASSSRDFYDHALDAIRRR